MADTYQNLIKNLEMRPKCYITLTQAAQPKTSRDYLNGNFTDLDFKGPLASIQKISIDSTRDVSVWRELNTATGGKPIESYPGLPSYELTLEKVVLYKENLLKAFGFNEHDISQQTQPSIIKLVMQSALAADSNGVTTEVAGTSKTWYIYGVWFKSNPMEFDVTGEGDLKIVQSINATAAGIVAG